MTPPVPHNAAFVWPRHCSGTEYAAFVHHTYANAESAKTFLTARDKFMAKYPDLRLWFQLPLAERIGRLYGQPTDQLANPVSYKARSYLYFLAMRGYAQFDWEWLIAVPRLQIWNQIRAAGLELDVESLIDEAVGLGYERWSARENLLCTVSRIFLHTARPSVGTLTEVDCAELLKAVRAFGERPDVTLFFGTRERYRRKTKCYGTALHCLHVVLFHRGQSIKEPRKVMPLGTPRAPLPGRMKEIIERYLATKLLISRPATVESMKVSLRHFAEWLTRKYPSEGSFADVRREQVLEFAADLDLMEHPRTGVPWSAYTKRGTLCRLTTFFRDVASWQWGDVPARPPLGIGDLPKMPQRIPRYIPEDELSRLMTTIRTLECPYQRAALLVARWSGARRNEILRLAIDCLDKYPDGTPRLRLPAGKTKRERIVPLNEEAAAAIRAIQAQHTNERGFRDSYTGTATQYLFMHHGRPFSEFYLFEASLRLACRAAGLVTVDGKPTVSPHRFRHTVGTQLAEKGAKLRTIMSVLGHSSASMSMVYAQISDREVLREYKAVLGPGAIIAGPYAEVLRGGDLSSPSIDWLKANFFKTELELGHCLRLPQEGPCECDFYLNCAKFVTTPEYAPRLRLRRKRELALVEDAVTHGWEREVERHRCAVRRIEQLLTDLGEAVDGPETTE